MEDAQRLIYWPFGFMECPLVKLARQCFTRDPNAISSKNTGGQAASGTFISDVKVSTPEWKSPA